MTLELVLDLLLVAALVFVAFRAIHAATLFTGVVVYIVFGAIMAVVWVRLEAPDLAIVEAAIGAGITGAILLEAARQLGGEGDRAPVLPRTGRLAATAVAAALALVLGAVFLTVGGRTGELPRAIAENLPASGVDHPITAVLLNFRAYDTWLELGVLLAAALGVLALRTPAGIEGEPDRTGGPPPVGTSAAALLAPCGVLIAGYLLWRGSHGPGGAFQAGAVLAAIAILLALLGRSPLARLPEGARDAALVAGLAAFLVFGLAGLARGAAFLEYGGAWAGPAILAIEAAAAISVAVTLLLLFVGGRAGPESSGRRPG